MDLVSGWVLQLVLWICGGCVGDHGKHLMEKRSLNKVVLDAWFWSRVGGLVVWSWETRGAALG